jgi:hypothetical protein
MTATEAQARLLRLQTEHYEATQAGVDPESSYAQRLQAAVDDARHDYVTSALVEIAALRETLAQPSAIYH